MSASWSSVRKSGALVLLILAGACTAPLVTAGGLTLTGDRLLGLAALATVAFITLRGGLHWTAVHSALALFAGIQLLSSALSSGSWPQGPKFSVIYILGFACFALAAEWGRGWEGLQRATTTWIGVGAVFGFAGFLLAFLANLWQTRLWGTGLTEILEIRPHVRITPIAPTVTFNEWNLYSSFLLVALALALWRWPANDDGRVRGWRGFLPVSGIVLGLVFGLTRAAWVAMAGLLAFWLRARRPTWRQVSAVVAVGIVGLVLQAMAIGASPLYYRVFRPVEARRDINMTGRFNISMETIRSWLRAPVFGHGAGSTNRLRGEYLGLPPNVKPWNGNIVLFVLHDSGVVGLASLVGLVAVVAAAARRARARTPATAAAPMLPPLLAAGVALLFAYQFTHGLWLMYPYIYLGLLTAGVSGETSPG